MRQLTFGKRLWCVLTPYALVAVALVTNALPYSAQQREPIFRGRADLVTLDVAVTESDGKPIRDLTQGDFSVFEDGVAQPIVAFRAVTVSDRPWPAPWMGTVRQDVLGNEDPPGRLMAIVIDDALIGSAPAIANYVRDFLTRLVDGLGPDDRCAVVFTRDSRDAQPFTSDHERLRAAIGRFTIGFAGMDAVNDALTGSHFGVGMLGTLESVVQALGTSQHFPRALIYVGPGLGINWDDVSRPGQVGDVGSGTLARQQVQQTYAARLRSILSGAAQWNIPIHAVMPAGIGSEDFHFTLARNTGGVTVLPRYEIPQEVARVDDATRLVYLLGYVPRSLTSGLRRVDVKVNRPGAIVRTRSYLDRPSEADEQKNANRKPADLAAIAGLLPNPGVPLRVMAVPMPIGSARDAAVEIVLGIKHPSSGRRAIETVSLVTAAYDMEGRFKAGARGRAQVQMTNAASDAAEYEVYSRLQLPPGRYQLRFSVDHRARNETGSVYTDIDVPDFRGSRLQIAGLLLDAGPMRLKGAPPDTFANDLPILPTAQREFPQGARFVAFARLVQGGSAPLEPISVTWRLTDEGNRIVRSGTDSVTPAQFGRGRTTDYRIGVTTDGLAGWYLLTVEATPPTGAAERKDLIFKVTAR